MLGRVLVTGGAGFLGSHMVELLHDRAEELGVEEIVVLDMLDHVRWTSPTDNARIKGYCADWYIGSVTDAVAVARAVRGCTTVIHMASIVDTGTVSKELMYSVNVKGTDTILAACVMEPSVRALVYCSSLDVVCAHTDFRDKDGVNEDTTTYAMDDPNVDTSRDVYCITKALSEKRVLNANRSLDSPGLRTGSIRPVGLYGERDTVHIGTLLETGRNLGSFGFFKFGDGSAVVQHVYARNCAYMHALLAKKLVEGDDTAAGQAFFGIDNTKVGNFFDFFRPYLAMKGYRVPTLNIPEWLIYPVAAFAEDVFLLLRAVAPSLVKNVTMKLSRRAIQGTCVSIWFDTDKARRLLGYIPDCTPMESRRRTLEYFSTNVTELFPQGSFKYNFEVFNEVDEGVDYRPRDEKYLKRRAENAAEKNRTGKSFNRFPLKNTRWCILVLGVTGLFAARVVKQLKSA